MIAACLLSFCTGFLSLGLEILWVRLFSYANYGIPQAFAFVLAFYLIGIALGAYIGKGFCGKSNRLWLICGGVLVISSISDLLSPWIYAAFAPSNFQLGCAALMITLTALLKAIIFPIAHHLGAPAIGSQVGRRISRVYVANIFGSTLGPLCIGLGLLSIFTAQQCFVLIAAATFSLALFCLITNVPLILLGASTLGAAMLVDLMLSMDKNTLMASISAQTNRQGLHIKYIKENQYGVITIYDGGLNGDIVMGGNVYDGRTNLNPLINSNGINRILILAALQEKPKHVLMIGLSIGTWLKLVETFPGIESIDVVEINPGYLDAIKKYPDQNLALTDPRVHIYIDDGRRWLKAHARNKYDMIVMNTTFHWRAYSSNLLSQEFLEILKQHMNPDAVLAYNSTGSYDALKTATKIFSNAYLYENIVIAADFDWRVKLLDPHAAAVLANLQINKHSLFPPDSEGVIRMYLAQRIVSVSLVEPLMESLGGRRLEIITDRNLITEYKYGRRLHG